MAAWRLWLPRRDHPRGAEEARRQPRRPPARRTGPAMTAPADRAAQPPGQPKAAQLAAAAVNGQAAASAPGTRRQPPSETDGQRPVPSGSPPVTDTGQPPRVKGGGLLAAASGLLL